MGAGLGLHDGELMRATTLRLSKTEGHESQSHRRSSSPFPRFHQPTRVCPEQYVRVKLKGEERAADERKGWDAEVHGRQGEGETWGQRGKSNPEWERGMANEQRILRTEKGLWQGELVNPPRGVVKARRTALATHFSWDWWPYRFLLTFGA
jgi:hypothetical protein